MTDVLTKLPTRSLKRRADEPLFLSPNSKRVRPLPMPTCSPARRLFPDNFEFEFCWTLQIGSEMVPSRGNQILRGDRPLMEIAESTRHWTQSMKDCYLRDSQRDACFMHCTINDIDERNLDSQQLHWPEPNTWNEAYDIALQRFLTGRRNIKIDLVFEARNTETLIENESAQPNQSVPWSTSSWRRRMCEDSSCPNYGDACFSTQGHHVPIDSSQHGADLPYFYGSSVVTDLAKRSQKNSKKLLAFFFEWCGEQSEWTGRMSTLLPFREFVAHRNYDIVSFSQITIVAWKSFGMPERDWCRVMRRLEEFGLDYERIQHSMLARDDS